jgi:hypothetical protein
MSELAVPASVLAEVRSALSSGRSGLESVASSAPASVDAGEMTAMLLGMLATVVDNAAGVSEGLVAVHDQVAVAETAFWETDAAEAARYLPGGIR